MLNRNLGNYWTFCWGIIVPGTILLLFLYFSATYTTLTYNGMLYPNSAIIFGVGLALIALLQVPAGSIYSYYKSKNSTFQSKMAQITSPTKQWGPLNPTVKNEWTTYLEESKCKNIDEYLLISKNNTNEMQMKNKSDE